MAKYPYSVKTGSLKGLLQRIPEIGVPARVTQTLLYSLGFKSTNDRSGIPILRFLGFLDDSSVPTELYKAYRDRSKSKAVLASALKTAYRDLFAVYSNAQDQSISDLVNYFSTNTGLGQRAVKATAETFKALCSLADFGAVVETHTLAEPPNSHDDRSLTKHHSKTDYYDLKIPTSAGDIAILQIPKELSDEDRSILRTILTPMLRFRD